jgi:hypothetical protein
MSQLPNTTSFSMNPACIALIEILRQIEAQPYHWPIVLSLSHNRARGSTDTVTDELRLRER